MSTIICANDVSAAGGVVSDAVWDRRKGGTHRYDIFSGVVVI